VTGKRTLVSADQASLPALPPEVLEVLDPHLGGIVSDFYDRLAQRPELKAVVERLTTDELAHLQVRQVAHLRHLLSPRLTAEGLRARSREVGRVHAMTGVELDWYVTGVTEHRLGLWAALAEHFVGPDLPEVQRAVAERFMADLHGAVLGYREMDAAENRVLLEVLRHVSSAATVADLTRGLGEALGGLDGISLVMFARPDANGRMETELVAGPGSAAFLAEVARTEHSPVTTSEDLATGLGPIGRAWRSGRIERSDSLKTDPTAAPWRDLVLALRWGSSAAIPLVDRSGRTRALVSLQAAWTGFFATEARMLLLEQVKQVAEDALTDLEDSPALTSGVRTFSDRAGHLALLAAGDVEMLFQPVVDLPSGRLTKVEALARLRTPERLLSPAEFLPSFGDDELYALFDLGLRQCLDALTEWQAAGLTTGASLNLPVAALSDDRYARLVAAVLPSYDVEPGRITLELLETGVVDRKSGARPLSLDHFKRLGLRLSQDDLGSGYSSLLRLRHFAFDEAKIDQSLVHGTELARGAALHFIAPLTDIAHSLGLHVVLEGLETDGLIEAAVQLGVDAGQGYGIARPMARDQVVGWAEGYRLDVDPARPRTALGVLAGHVAWEHRVSAMRDSSSRDMLLDLDDCPLTSYVRCLGDRPDALHREVHAAALTQRGSAEHRAAWERLAFLVDPT
jgi:EAL domain-containing protein (putative c-di-GMP-specific phosphodiesterase class I)